MDRHENPLKKLGSFGQSLWLDFLSRQLLKSDALKRLIEEDDLRGITTNPAILEKAIGETSDYEESIEKLAREGKSPEEIYEAIVLKEVQHAADVLRPVHDRLEGNDGFVSLEVSPHLAHDTEGTLVEARYLWNAVDRPNVMIKVPGTEEGLPAIQQLIFEGINVNVTLLFALPRYRKAAAAYLEGLEGRARRRESLKDVHSVASFFLSRIDSAIDPMLDKKLQDEEEGPQAEAIAALRGKTGISCAKVAHDMYQGVFGTQRFRDLVAQGASPQRLLWASTSTKNPAYSDVMYVDSLIGPDTVTTLPMDTLEAYRDHGHPAPRLEEGLTEAYNHLQAITAMGIDLETVARRLEQEGVEKFVQPWDRLLRVIEQKAGAIVGSTQNR